MSACRGRWGGAGGRAGAGGGLCIAAATGAQAVGTTCHEGSPTLTKLGLQQAQVQAQLRHQQLTHREATKSLSDMKALSCLIIVNRKVMHALEPDIQMSAFVSVACEQASQLLRFTMAD